MKQVSIANNEQVARILKNVWYSEGIVSPAAFYLRPHIREFYISVLREMMETFSTDAQSVVKGRGKCFYASLNSGQIRMIEVSALEEIFTIDTIAIDNSQLKSHAGIFLSLNGQIITGGEPFVTFKPAKGIASDAVLLDVGEELAHVAQQSIKEL